MAYSHSRRGFLQKSVLALSSISVVHSSVFAKYSPSNRITMGCIGVGGMGTNNLRTFMGQPDVQILAVCDGVELICKTGEYGVQTTFNGSEGQISYGYAGFFARPDSLKKIRLKPNDLHLKKSNNHHRNLLNCIKLQNDPVAPVEVGHRSATICHLGNIAMRLKQKLNWDPVKEKFINNETANQYLHKPMRNPWCL